MDADPNWLPSTTAQATAALVAIVGGLLVSRVVTIGTEKASLERRHRDLSARLKVVRDRWREAHDARLHVSQDWFREHHVMAIASDPDGVDLERLVEEFCPIGSSESEMLSYAEHLRGAVRDATASMKVTYGSSGFPEPDLDVMRSDGLLITREGETEDVYLAVASRLHRSRLSGFELASISSMGIPSSDIHLVRQDQRIRDEVVLAGSDLEMSRELEILEAEIAGLSRPTAVWSTLTALAFFALVGMVGPLILMSFRPVPDTVGTRVGLISAFALGLIGLCVVLVFNIQRLRHPRGVGDGEGAHR